MSALISMFLGTDDLIKLMLFFQIISMTVLIVLHHFFKEKHEKLCMLLSALPLLVFIVFFAFNYVKGNMFMGYQRYIGFGAAAFLIFIWGLAVYFRKTFKAYTLIACILLTMCFSETFYVIFLVNYSPYFSNFSHYGWTESFEKMVDELEESYVLGGWKEINFNKIRSELIPEVQKAENENDEPGFIVALYKLRYELYDGHIWFQTNNPDARSEAVQRLTGNDYGLSLFKDNTGNVLAVMTDESGEAYKKGIRDGTEITKWNGVPIDEAVSQVRCIDSEYVFSSIENEEIFKPAFLAGKGGNEISVSFIDEYNKEQTISIKKSGSYRSRLYSLINTLYGKNFFSNENLYSCMLNDNCGYLRVNSESFFDLGKDEIKAVLTGYYSELGEKLRADIKLLENQGMDRMIIDLRNNKGGYDFVSQTIASLFLDKPMMPDITNYKNGKFVQSQEARKIGRAEWQDIPIVIIVNGETCSSGESLAYWLSRCDNAVVLGNTNTWGCAQGTGGVSILTDDTIEVFYPVYAALTENHEPISDPKSDRKARIRLDYQITYDREEVIELFKNSGDDDYILNQALDYISK